MVVQSIYQLLADQAAHYGQLPAILAPGRSSLTYAQLFSHAAKIKSQLNSAGIDRSDRVAIVLPNGPEMATAFLSVAACAASAPLNPGYREREFDFYLSDLEAKAVIVPVGTESPVVSVAHRQGIPILELAADLDGPAGLFSLHSPQSDPAAGTDWAGPTDVGLLLHTSGTTSRPKMVPLTQTNLCESAGNIRRSLNLSSDDRCLNIMPLFHIHGLMSVVMASMTAGGSVVCTPGFHAANFFPWMKEAKPSWYTAVPTMHQAVLARAESNQEIISQKLLRLIRSCSASLAPQIMNELENVFQAPVIEAYGMTEACHQIASNPLPPLTRKPGSVGLSAGSQIAIARQEKLDFLPPGELGEIVIRGPGLTPGYVNNPEANSSAFTDGWFRTGDQGYLDDDGYLFLTGRLKEIINRGGEKISPREIDEVLLQHPTVKQAVAFAMPDKRLGEEVAAAVVLNLSPVTEKELRRFASGYLADFKVPRRILILEEIPKGPTGKLQRIGLAEKLGLLDHPGSESYQTEFTAPRSEAETLLADLWCQVLGLEEISIHQKFLDSGGDSFSALLLVNLVRENFSVEPSLIDFFDSETVADQAQLLMSWSSDLESSTA